MLKENPCLGCSINQDWEEVDPLIHSNCTVTFSSGSLHKGKDQVEKDFRGNFW